ncbi:MAG: prepilin-type N-terminal cleavage/methylation domain-containing protein [Oligoflexia bacterium]|nr:prepilin-type N-terminal cleavage/methylation domain-containing protein [Oligoflexia bacterium]
MHAIAQRWHRHEGGFTLIELLTIIAIIGVLGGLGLASFKVYRSDAAYSVTESTLRNARNSVEASVNNPDVVQIPVALVSQNVPGEPQDASAHSYLPAFMIPKNVKVSVFYDPSCSTAACQSDMLEVSHCFANEYTRWVRLGDGSDFLLEHLAGGGC